MPIERLGPYRIERLLGQGGMGAVYVGVNDETGERAAIKSLSDVLAADPRFRERFRGEVESLKRLRQENIVALHGFGEEEGRLFFVMELVDGSSLEAELRAGRLFSWREAADIGIQVCAALKHAHDHGVIHRDLKPANLLMTEDGTVKLTDFGIAKFFGSTSLTMVGSMIGTPDYMSPEQTDGNPVTPRSDLYSLGCVLYALMAGKPPFSGASVTKVIDDVRFRDPAPLRFAAPDAPEELERIVGQLLRKKPEERIATAQLLSNLLRAMRHALSPDGRSPDDSEDGHALHVDNAVDRKPDDATGHDDSTRLSTSERPTMDLTPEEKREFEYANAESSVPRPSSVQTKPSFCHVEPPPGETMAEAEPKTHFTSVSEEDWRGAIDEPDSPQRERRERLAIVFLILSLVIIGSAFVFAFWPMSADGLYDRIHSLSQTDNSSGEYGEFMEEFLERFPADPRHAEVESRLTDYRCRQLRDDLLDKVRSLTEEEKLFIKGMQLADEAKPKEAEACFKDIVAKLRGSPLGAKERRLLERSQHMLEKIAGARRSTAVPQGD